MINLTEEPDGVDNKTVDEYYQQPMVPHKIFRKVEYCSYFLTALLFFLPNAVFAQATQAAKIELGSATAKNGFQNETEIQNKFNNWKVDADARLWLPVMGYSLAEIEIVTATKPHGEKADVEVRIKAKSDEKVEGISIKLVSSPNGFNQIDKRWLSHYVKMWKMPTSVEDALKRFVGEIPPSKPGRAKTRVLLDELDPADRESVIAFFTNNKKEIVSDIFQGDGLHAAEWVMVAFKATVKTRWALRRIEDVIEFYSAGPVVVTSGGNLKIGRITMQRKGGDGGRETANMLQFKINPALLLDH